MESIPADEADGTEVPGDACSLPLSEEALAAEDDAVAAVGAVADIPLPSLTCIGSSGLGRTVSVFRGRGSGTRSNEQYLGQGGSTGSV